ncbi:hypothetical protein MUK42_36210 [Musa troglodytarum]|uniref:Uncharacterized protein n=1 Tax=Musa troglodytarum TaxID=320322 RepID=A0A9E7JUK1_9LILI|nr:hypothetical protein MUK42_36210 [Musa troglodytarum]
MACNPVTNLSVAANFSNKIICHAIVLIGNKIDVEARKPIHHEIQSRYGADIYEAEVAGVSFKLRSLRSFRRCHT